MISINYNFFPDKYLHRFTETEKTIRSFSSKFFLVPSTPVVEHYAVLYHRHLHSARGLAERGGGREVI